MHINRQNTYVRSQHFEDLEGTSHATCVLCALYAIALRYEVIFVNRKLEWFGLSIQTLQETSALVEILYTRNSRCAYLDSLYILYIHMMRVYNV